MRGTLRQRGVQKQNRVCMALPLCTCERCTASLAALTDAARATVCRPTGTPTVCASNFLEVAGGDEGKASHLITSTLIWREEFGYSTSLEQFAEERAHAVQRVCPCGISPRRDREGRGVVVIRVGFAEPTMAAIPAFFVAGDAPESCEEAWQRHLAWVTEQAARIQDQRVLILDLANLSRRHLTKQALGALHDQH